MKTLRFWFIKFFLASFIALLCIFLGIVIALFGAVILLRILTTGDGIQINLIGLSAVWLATSVWIAHHARWLLGYEKILTRTHTLC